MRLDQGFQIKICGIRSPAMADVAAESGAQAVGLVFAPRSPRCVSFSEAKEVLRALPGSVEPVGLWVDPDDQLEDLARMVGELGLHTLQFHGRCEQAIEQMEHCSVLRAMSFSEQMVEESLKQSDRWAAQHPNVKGVLMDAHDPSGIGGGTGKSFDWTVLRAAMDRARPLIPLVLAGGLNADNVALAVEQVRPEGVDVSSGVESARGVKDAALIRRFCLAARQAADRWMR